MIDLFREWDADGDGNVTRKEFHKAMPKLGFDVPKEQIDEVFNGFDPDGSGEVSYTELKKFLTRKAGDKTAAAVGGQKSVPTQRPEPSVQTAASAVGTVGKLKALSKMKPV